MSLGGKHLRDFAVPDRYKPAGSNSGLVAGDRGIYNNLAFESLSMSPDGRTLWTATENGLAQDSLPSGVNNGSRSRLLSFDIASGAAGCIGAISINGGNFCRLRVSCATCQHE